MSPNRALRKLTLMLTSAAAAIAALALVNVWLEHRSGRQAAEGDAHFHRGDVLVDQGKLEEAVAEFREAIRINPGLAEAHVYLGTILGHQRKLDEAVAEFREAIRIDPDLAEAHVYLGTILGHQGKVAEAVAVLREAIWLKPDSALAHFNLATTLQTQGKLETATAEFRTAIRLKPNDVEAHYSLGNALQARGKLEESIAEYRAAIRLKPDHAKAHYNVGVALHRQGKLAEAIAEYREVIRTNPDDVAARYTLGSALSDQGEPELAIIAYRDAIRIKPDLAPAHGNLARVLVLPPKRPRRDYDEGLAHASKAVELAPNDGYTVMTLALAEYRLGHWTESQAACEKSLALLNRGDPSSWFLMALADWQKGEKDKARSWFNQAVAWIGEKQNPKNSTLRQLWTEAAVLLGRPGPDAAGAGSPPAPTAEKRR